MNYNDKLIIELIKQLVISSNCPFWYKQNIIREIDNFTYFKDIMNPNDYYKNLIWYIAKEIFSSSGIIPNYYN